jgi:hypothetical protein
MENASNINYFPGQLETKSVSFIDRIRGISWPVWLIIFVVLAFLGFNIFILIGQGSETIGSWLNSIIEKLKASGKLANTIKNTIYVSATGTKGIVEGTADVSNDVLENVQDKTNVGLVPEGNETSTSSLPQTTITNSHPLANSQNTALNNALNNAINTSSAQQAATSNISYQADDTLSSIQSGGSKSGWCFIGEDRGFRSCAYVNSGDDCMSGSIFPSNEICINPSLRE